MRCALYVRVRTNEQAKSGYSIPTNCRTFGARYRREGPGLLLAPALLLLQVTRRYPFSSRRRSSSVSTGSHSWGWSIRCWAPSTFSFPSGDI